MPGGEKFIEAHFEHFIITSIYASGVYVRRGKDSYDAKLSLISYDVLSCIKSTQHDLWHSFVRHQKAKMLLNGSSSTLSVTNAKNVGHICCCVPVFLSVPFFFPLSDGS
jgi:hypothetical protein